MQSPKGCFLFRIRYVGLSPDAGLIGLLIHHRQQFRYRILCNFLGSLVAISWLATEVTIELVFVKSLVRLRE